MRLVHRALFDSKVIHVDGSVRCLLLRPPRRKDGIHHFGRPCFSRFFTMDEWADGSLTNAFHFQTATALSVSNLMLE